MFETTHDARTHHRTRTLALVGLGIVGGLIAGRLGWTPAVTEAQVSRGSLAPEVQVFAGGGNVDFVLIDQAGFAWHINRRGGTGGVSDDLLRLSSGSRVVGDERQTIYRNFATNRDYTWNNGRMVPLPESAE
jgi:hypothetical protein